MLTGIHLRNVKITINTQNSCFSGALAGMTSGSVISFCTAQGEISVASAGQIYAGGITGWSTPYLMKAVISHCRTDVKVTGDAGTTSSVGGIVGRSDEQTTIFACEASGSLVSAKGSGKVDAGGIIGYLDSYYQLISRVIYCAANTEEIKGTNDMPGLVNYTGGLVGTNADNVISSYARVTTMEVQGLSIIGAIIGYGSNQTSNDYFCIGTCPKDQGYSDLYPIQDNLVYDEYATDKNIYDLVTRYTVPETISTTTYDPTHYPAYGIEVTDQTFRSTDVWDYNPTSGKIRIKRLPPITPP